MRAEEFMARKKERRRGLTLRHLNRLKREQQRRQRAFAARRRLVAVMYGDPARATPHPALPLP